MLSHLSAQDSAAWPPTRRQGIFWICTLSVEKVPDLPCLRLGELPSSLVWICGQKEAGGTSGYLHWQFCCAFAKKASLATVRGLFGRSVHAELSRSELASVYCTKEESRVEGPWEWGCKPIRRNAKTDWEQVWNACKSGDLDAIPASIRVVSYRTIRAIASDFSPCPGMVREVFVFWGPTGTGKSRRAWDEGGVDSYPKDPRSKFWDGYGDQQNVIMDEFRGMMKLTIGGIDIAHLLRWFDRYPCRVEVKGSSRPLVATKIWITSNLNPEMWYPELDYSTQQALIRRLNITEFA
uniref:Replication-associated protein n=1 Tax=Cressdnaviricota sp. TaxID=2748378 RepID=A0A345MQF6_9VIRU